MDFRQTPQDVAVTETTTPQAVETPNVVEGKEDVATGKDLSDASLEVWETEKNRKYGVDYFNIRELATEFPLKAQFGSVDKYIKQEIEERGWEKNTKNWEKIIGEIEDEIGTREMSQYNRMQKIFNYIQVLRKYQEIKKKRNAFKAFKEE